MQIPNAGGVRQEVNAVLESEEAPMQAASPSSTDDIEFSPESQDDIANLTPPIRLSQDEVSEGLVDYGKVQRLIFKRLGDRVMSRPAEFVSPFQINRKRPDIPVSKVVYLRQKIISEPELQQYVSFFTVYFFHVAIVLILALQLLHSQFCNLHTFRNHTFSTFLQPLTQTNLQSHVVKPSCNCFHTGIATVTLAVLQFAHFFAITHSALFFHHSHRPICNHMLSNLVAMHRSCNHS
jgi:hypothetical protein